MKKELFDIYLDATRVARDLHQTAGDRNDYYITLEQLEKIIQKVIG